MRHKFLAVFIIICVFVNFSVLAFLIEANQLLNAKFLANTLREGRVYETLPKLAEGKFTGLGADLQSSFLMKIVIQSLNPISLQQEIEKAIDVSVSLIKNKPTKNDFTFDLTPFKQKFQNTWESSGGDIFLASYKDLPPCDQLNQMAPEGDKINCQAEGVSDQEIKAQINNLDPNDVLKGVPDNLSFKKYVQDNNVFKKAQTAYKIGTIAFYVLSVATLLLIIWLIYLGRGDWRALTSWIGIALLLPNAAILVFTLILKSSLLYVVLRLKSVGTDYVNVIKPLIAALGSTAFEFLIRLSAIFAILAVILIIVSFFLPKKPPEAQKTSAPLAKPGK